MAATTTITPLQALSLYNNKFVLRQCEHLAERLQREAGGIEAQIERAYSLLFSRPPTRNRLRLLCASPLS